MATIALEPTEAAVLRAECAEKDATIAELTSRLARVERELAAAQDAARINVMAVVDAAQCARCQRYELPPRPAGANSGPHAGAGGSDTTDDGGAAAAAIDPALLPRLVSAAPPPFSQFDEVWYAAAIAGTNFECTFTDTDGGCVMECIGQQDCPGNVIESRMALRAAGGLPRLADPTATAENACRFVFEEYPFLGYHFTLYATVGFLPSSTTPQMVVPKERIDAAVHGGWEIGFAEREEGFVGSNWFALNPALPGESGTAAGAALRSTYATTTTVPKLPPGGAVELAVNYEANTAYVAFYAPTAVAADFRGPTGGPFARMELQFAKRLPTNVVLHPAINVIRTGLKVKLLSSTA